MNFLKKCILIMSSLWPAFIPAVMGCLDNSDHLKRKYDSKNWHFVECYCPCVHMVNQGTQCKDCGHKRILPRLIDHVDPQKRGYTGSLSHYPSPGQVLKKLCLGGKN